MLVRLLGLTVSVFGSKTMFSLGSYHENIVNLQGITYEADHKYDTLTQVS